MQKTIQIKLLPSYEQKILIHDTMKTYIKTVNNCVADMVTFNQFSKLSSANIDAELPSAVKNQAILDSKSIFKKYRKTKIEPILKKPIAIWNNQNYKIDQNNIELPVLIDGKSKRISIKCVLTQDIIDILSTCKLGTLRITPKNNKIIAQIAIEVLEPLYNKGNTMGIDLGIKCPAVCTIDSSKIKFIGNGRQNKYIRRHYKTKRKKIRQS